MTYVKTATGTGAALVLLVASLAAGQARAQGVQGVLGAGPGGSAVTSADLESALSPHGEWLIAPPWGRVWRPYSDVVGDDFAPYLSNGRWLYGAYGWTFNSSYPWGWAAFHFGRWVFHEQEGWVWTTQGITAPTWGPGWVWWRTGGGFVGWLPQTPRRRGEVPHQYASLWSVVHLRHLQSADLSRRLFPAERIAYAPAMAPPGVGVPVGPLASWRGYPQLNAALAASTGAAFFPFVTGVRALWFGSGSSVHAPPDLGHAAGASQLWTGPGSSVFSSPAFGTPSNGQRQHGWSSTPR